MSGACHGIVRALSVPYEVCLLVIRLVQLVFGYRAELGDDLLEKVVVDLHGEPRHQHPDAGLVRAIRLVRMAAPIIAGQSPPRTCRMPTTACKHAGDHRDADQRSRHLRQERLGCRDRVARLLAMRRCADLATALSVGVDGCGDRSTETEARRRVQREAMNKA